ncbi:RNA polymerase sigma24 factor [Sesbania bispinosa]|nr:RNA polymerase sigma24 factor [Sesbania bispinosa]
MKSSCKSTPPSKSPLQLQALLASEEQPPTYFFAISRLNCEETLTAWVPPLFQSLCYFTAQPNERTSPFLSHFSLPSPISSPLLHNQTKAKI